MDKRIAEIQKSRWSFLGSLRGSLLANAESGNFPNLNSPVAGLYEKAFPKTNGILRSSEAADDEKNRSTRSGGPKVCCCAGEYRARIMACSVIFHAITIGYRRKGVSPIKGGGDTRAGGLFNPGRTLESRVDLLRPSRKLNLWRLTHVGGGLEYRFTPHIGVFSEIAYDFPNLSNNNFIQTNFGLRFAF